MVAAARKLLRRTHLRGGATSYDRLPWELQRFVFDFLRTHRCEITPDNCQVVAEAMEYRLMQSGLMCPAELWLVLEKDVFFD